MKKNRLIFFSIVCLLTSCGNKKNFDPNNVEIIHQNEEMLTQTIIYDIFSPPVASRIYAYTSLAQYEAVRFLQDDNASITAQLNGFAAMPLPQQGKQYNFILCAVKAFTVVAYNVRIFNDSLLRHYEDSLTKGFKETLQPDVFANSIAFGDSVARVILARAKTDMYKETRGMAKYLGSSSDGKWRPTAPDYLDATEPWWRMMYPLALDTCSQFRPAAPPAYSADSNSIFYKAVKEVYTTIKNLSDSQKTVARYWDDNPFVIEHTGHLMFGNKKITPGGHWMGITSIACHATNADAVKSAKAYALVATGLYDAFVSCWDTKYTYEYVRPITLINEWFEKGWDSYLQTPPFPEYTSGHSTISGAASTVLTNLFGENFSFHDNSDSAYIGMVRNFSSFDQAADEASNSRLLGGIHYKFSLDTGIAKGRLIGRYLMKKVK